MYIKCISPEKDSEKMKLFLKILAKILATLHSVKFKMFKECVLDHPRQMSLKHPIFAHSRSIRSFRCVSETRPQRCLRDKFSTNRSDIFENVSFIWHPQLDSKSLFTSVARTIYTYIYIYIVYNTLPDVQHLEELYKEFHFVFVLSTQSLMI